MENTVAGSGLNATRNGRPQDSSSRVRVFARVKPLTGRDAGAASGVRVCEAASAVRVLVEPGVPLDGSHSGSFSRDATQAQEFIYDGVFPPESTQAEVFDEVGFPILREVMRGFNGTVLAYGQTGSGKTHSLLNAGGAEAGLMPRICSSLFEMASQDPTSEYTVEAAAVQVYNEQVDDLLHPQHKSGTGNNLNILNSGEVPGLTWISCNRHEQLIGAFTRARTNLVYAETKMNKASSRSHAVFQMRITRRSEVESTCSVLNVVDLAGSERVKKSGAEGDRFREATAINKSLLALGNVVNALASRKSHIPFRDSKLTHVLAPAIGGNCKTSLLVCASPAQEHVGETLCSLEFASRAMNIQVDARVNRLVSIDIKGLLNELKAVPDKEERIDQAQVLREELARSRQTAVDTETRAEHAEGRATIAEQRLQDALARIERAEERANAAERTNGALRDKAVSASAADSIERVEYERQIAALRADLDEKQTRLELTQRESEKWQAMYNMNELQVVRLEAKLVQRGEVMQLRNAALCKAMAALEQLQTEMDSRELEVQRALDDKAETGQKLQQVSTLESELREARTTLIAKSAEASFEQMRAQNEADRLAQTRSREQEKMDARREQMFKELDDEKWELGLKQEAFREQERELQQRIAMVEGLEREKRELARQRKELEKERQDMQLRERRAHNGAVGKGPPARSPSISKMLQAPSPLDRTVPSPSSETSGGGKLPPFGYRGPAVAVAAAVQASEGGTGARRSASVTTTRSPATPAAARSRTPTPTRSWRSHSKS